MPLQQNTTTFISPVRSARAGSPRSRKRVVRPNGVVAHVEVAAADAHAGKEDRTDQVRKRVLPFPAGLVDDGDIPHARELAVEDDDRAQVLRFLLVLARMLWDGDAVRRRLLRNDEKPIIDDRVAVAVFLRSPAS